ncbi:MAG TPA: enoyl-CoA hydratase/isomerase family protein [Microbacterium sp.]|nr:enoyl-CoA hydratase/isomerase family protein [Microbacterium sp.]
MSFIEVSRAAHVRVIRLNRPERLNALSRSMVVDLRDAIVDFGVSEDRVLVITGEGRAFCAGEDLKESAEIGVPEDARFDTGDPFGLLEVPKPSIAAVNGYAFGGGFMLAADCDLRLSVPEAQFEVSEIKRWHLGGVSHGIAANLPQSATAELALGFRMEAGRLHELGFLNRVVGKDQLLPAALQMAEHLASLPPAARQNTVRFLRATRPELSPEQADFADRLRGHGADSDLIESRAAFAEKRAPIYRGWDEPDDEFDWPRLGSIGRRVSGGS